MRRISFQIPESNRQLTTHPVRLMKTEKNATRILSVMIGTVFMAAFVGFLNGCASPGYEKGASASASLAESSQAIQTTSTRLDASLAALNDLITNPRPDLRPQYESFSAS